MSWFTPKCNHEWDQAACTYSEPLKDYTFKENAWQNYTIKDMLQARSIIQNGQTTIEYQCFKCGEHYQAKLIGKRIDNGTD